jgi:hypothetical protein
MSLDRVLPNALPPMRLTRMQRRLLTWGINPGLVVALVLLVPGMVLGPDKDAGVFAAVGAGIVDGKTPYLDLWDHKPPGIYLIDAFARLLPGATWGAIWGLSFLAILATGWYLWTLTDRRTAVLGTFILASYPAAQGGGLTETFATLFAAVALVGACRTRWLLAGVALGAACATSLQLLPAGVAIALLARRWRDLGAAGLGAAAIGGALLAWLGLAGPLPAAVDAVIRYSSIYLGLDRTADVREYAPQMLLMLLPLVGLAALGGRPSSRLDWACIIWFALGAGLVASNGRFFPHYTTPLIVPLTILAGRGVRRLPRARRWALPAFMLATIGWSTLVVFHQLPVQAGQLSFAVADWLDAHTQPSDSVLIWGHYSGAAVIADRETSGRYPYLLPLTTPGYTTPAMVGAWLAQLEADPPAAIVDIEGGFGVPPAGSAGGRTLDIVQPFRDWVARHYVLAGTIKGRPAYTRVSASWRCSRHPASGHVLASLVASRSTS